MALRTRKEGLDGGSGREGDELQVDVSRRRFRKAEMGSNKAIVTKILSIWIDTGGGITLKVPVAQLTASKEQAWSVG